MWEVEGRDEVSVHRSNAIRSYLSFSTSAHLGHHPHLEVLKHVTNHTLCRPRLGGLSENVFAMASGWMGLRWEVSNFESPMKA